MSHLEVPHSTHDTSAGDSPAARPQQGNRAPARQRRLLAWLAGAIVVLILLVGLAWWFRPAELHGILIQSPSQADDFTLLATTGDPMQLSDFRGKYVVLFFGYTYCPDICPTTLNDLAVMAEELGPSRMDDIQVIMISVDPERDTVEQLSTYLRHFNPSFLGMTGSVEEIQPVASEFGIFFEKHADTGLVDHTGAVTVLDRDGYVRLIFPKGLEGPNGSDMAQDLKYLMRRG